MWDDAGRATLLTMSHSLGLILWINQHIDSSKRARLVIPPIYAPISPNLSNMLWLIPYYWQFGIWAHQTVRSHAERALSAIYGNLFGNMSQAVWLIPSSIGFKPGWTRIWTLKLVSKTKVWFNLKLRDCWSPQSITVRLSDYDHEHP